MFPQLIEKYAGTGHVKFVWHDFAWIGEESRLAAQGARCAGREGMFWGFHDMLYANQRGYNQGQFSAANLKRYAADLGLNTDAFGACLDAAEDVGTIRSDLAAARAAGITATPLFIINGERVAGPQSVELFSEIIDAKLSEAGIQ